MIYKFAIRWLSVGYCLAHLIVFVIIIVSVAMTIDVGPLPYLALFGIVFAGSGLIAISILSFLRLIFWTRDIIKYVWELNTPSNVQTPDHYSGPWGLPERTNDWDRTRLIPMRDSDRPKEWKEWKGHARVWIYATSAFYAIEFGIVMFLEQRLNYRIDDLMTGVVSYEWVEAFLSLFFPVQFIDALYQFLGLDTTSSVLLVILLIPAFGYMIPLRIYLHLFECELDAIFQEYSNRNLDRRETIQTVLILIFTGLISYIVVLFVVVNSFTTP